MQAFHEEEYKGYTIKIFPDEDGPNPRRDFDPLGHMVCFHKRYDLGDKHDMLSEHYNSWEEVEKAIREENDVAVMLPLYLYDHSGITMRTTPFSCPWDSGQVGFIYLTKTEVREGWKYKRLTKKRLQKMEEILVSVVEEYDHYLRGNVSGFVIEDDDENEIDSCWGFFGYWDDEEYGSLAEARGIIDNRTQEKKTA